MDTKNYGPEYIRDLIEEAPTTRELLQLALKVQMDMQEGHVDLNELLDSIDAISAHLERPEPEPTVLIRYDEYGDPELTIMKDGIPLYTKEQL